MLNVLKERTLAVAFPHLFLYTHGSDSDPEATRKGQCSLDAWLAHVLSIHGSRFALDPRFILVLQNLCAEKQMINTVFTRLYAKNEISRARLASLPPQLLRDFLLWREQDKFKRMEATRRGRQCEPAAVALTSKRHRSTFIMLTMPHPVLQDLMPSVSRTCGQWSYLRLLGQPTIFCTLAPDEAADMILACKVGLVVFDTVQRIFQGHLADRLLLMLQELQLFTLAQGHLVDRLLLRLQELQLFTLAESSMSMREKSLVWIPMMTMHLPYPRGSLER